MKPKRGRPKKAEADKLSYRLQIFVTPSEGELIDDGSVSTWARPLLVKAAKRRCQR